MIEKTLKTTNGTIKVAIPSQLQEVTLGQLMEMQSTENLSDLQAVHILSGIATEELQNIKNFADLQFFSAHVAALSAQIRDLYNSDSIPKTLTFTNHGKPKTVKVITNLAIEPAGAFLAARDVITDEISRHIDTYGEDGWKENFNPSLLSCGLILAHYFYCPVTGNPYSEHEAEAFLEQVKQLPFADALPIAKYFFLSFPNLSKRRIGFWRRLQLCWKKRLELRPSGSLAMLTP